MIRVVTLVVLAAVALAASAGAGWAQHVGSPTGGSDVEMVASDHGEDNEACDGLPWAAGKVCDGVDSALAFGVERVVVGGAQAVLHEMVAFVVDGAAWLLGQVASFLETSTRPQLTSSWFDRAYQDMTVVAALGLLPFLLLAIIQSVVRQDLSMLLRAVFGYVPLAAVGTAAAVVVIDMLVQVTDLLSAWIGRSLGSDLEEFATGMGESLATLPAGAGGPVAGLAALFAAGVVAFAAFAIWLELLLRQAAIYVAVLFLPLGFMAMVWPATTHWLRRLVQGLVAIILSKFVIVAIMALAASALSAQAPEQGFAVVVAGASLLSLAALAPYVLLRLIPVFEAGLSGDLEGTYRRPTAAVASPATGGHMAQVVRRRAHGGAHGEASMASVSRGGAGGGPSATGGPASSSVSSSSVSTGGRSSASGAATPSVGGSRAAGGARAGAGEGAGAGAGGAAASGVAVGAGVVAAGVGTVAAGVGGAKRAGEHLQQHGDQQRAATSVDERGRSAGAAAPQSAPAPPHRSPPPGPDPGPPPRTSSGHPTSAQDR